MPNEFDSYRPPMEPRQMRAAGKKRRRNKNRAGAGAMDGSREERMVPNIEFESYYGKPVVKAPPWEWPIAVYLFLGGVAGGSSLLAMGADLTGRKQLRQRTRITAFSAAALGSVALIADLGKPTRLFNMFRVFKASSPMSWGSWLLGGFAGSAAVAAIPEGDKLLGYTLPLGPFRKFLQFAATPMGVAAGFLGAPLAVYTAVLFGNTSVPAWQEGRKHLPYLFVSSGSAAAGGLAMLTTDPEEAGPARALAVMGAVGDIAVNVAMEKQMGEVEREPYTIGTQGKLMKTAEWLAICGGFGAAVAGKNRVASVLSGAALVGSSLLTRFGVLEAGLESTKDPKYVIEPQRRRLEERRKRGQVSDSITTTANA